MISQAYGPILGVAVKFVVSYVRAHPDIPWLTQQSKGKVLAVTGVVSAIAGCIAAYSNGSFDEGTLQALIDAGQVAASAFGSAVAFHEVTEKL